MSLQTPQAAIPTVGDTIWVTRTVQLPPGRSVRAAEWDVADPVELLGPARVILHDTSAEVAYPLAVWRPGSHTLQMPGPLLLAPGGGVDSLAPEPVTLRVQSVLPRGAADTTIQPQPRAEFVPRPATTPVPLILLLVLAVALLAPLHWWWRRRGRPPARAAADPGPARPPLDRWADAGEPRAVAGAATCRLRAALAERVPTALPSLPTGEVLAHLAAERPEWPLGELGDLLRALDAARFGDGPPPDPMDLARRAAALEPRLVAVAA